MQQILNCSIAAAIGAMTGVVQWRTFMRDPLLKRTFEGHLDDVRRHWRNAALVMLVLVVLLVIFHDSLQVVKWAPAAFTTSWIGAVVFLSRWFSTTSVEEPARQ